MLADKGKQARSVCERACYDKRGPGDLLYSPMGEEMGAPLRLVVAFAIPSSFTRSFEFVGHCIFVCFVLSPFVVLREPSARNAPGSTKTGLVATPMTLPASVSHITPALCWRGWIVPHPMDNGAYVCGRAAPNVASAAMYVRYS